MPAERALVTAAVDAAESVIFSRYSRSDIADLDIAVSFEDDLLDVDIYLNVPAADDADQVAEDAALAAQAAVDDHLAGDS